MNIKRVTYYTLLFTCVVLGACTPSTTPDEPTPPKEDSIPESRLDKDPALVAACADWAQGGGKNATGGGSEPTIYRINSLDDLDAYKPIPGTLRYALSQNGARLIVFNVSGTIHLSAPLELKNGDVTILGQSAPGDGICIADYPLIVKKCSNVIIRYMRFRLGNKSLEKYPDQDYDAVSVNDCKNIILDHCSASWSVDECVSCYGNENFTLQYCMITESLKNAGHTKGAHGYGGIWGGKNATFHHNLLAHHDSRNPRFDHDYVSKVAGPIDYINNVVYNWGSNSAYGGEGSSNGGGGRLVNYVNNYYKPGPNTSKNSKTRLLQAWAKCDNCANKYGGEADPIHVYLKGNILYGSSEVTEDNWAGLVYSGEAKREQCEVATRYTYADQLTDEQSADKAYETVLAKAGCSLKRDAVDERIVDEVQNQKGKIIDTPAQVGGWPELAGAEIQDTDKDGMPDAWETQHGLNPNDATDWKTIDLVSHHTNLEVYLCDLVKELY